MAPFLTIIGIIFVYILFGSFLLGIAAIFIVGAGPEKSNDDYYE
jgi:hypothetical protein